MLGTVRYEPGCLTIAGKHMHEHEFLT